MRVPTLADFAKEFGGHLLAAEGAFWRTLRGLLDPGRLTLAYLAGERRRHLTPLRLFLSICLICAALLHGARPAQEQPIAELSIVNARIGMQEGRFVCEGLPEQRCAHWQRRVSADPELLQDLEHTRRTNSQVMRQLVFLAMPASLALMLQWGFWRRKQPFGMHMVASLHLHSVMLPAITAQVLATRWFPTVATVSGPLLAALLIGFCMRAWLRVYGERPWVIAVKGAAIGIGYTLVFSLWTSIAAHWTLQRTLM